MNYLLHNLYSYESDKVNFREIVLREVKDRCWHLRDYSLSQMDLYNVDKWIYDGKWELEGIESCQKIIDEYKSKDRSEEFIKKEYQKEVDKIESMHTWSNTYHFDYANKIERCLNTYKKYKDIFISKCSDNKMIEYLDDIETSAENDIKMERDENIESLRRCKAATVISYEKFKNDYLENIDDEIARKLENIRGYKQKLKRIDELNSYIKDMFNIIEEVEKEMKNVSID